MMQNRKNHYQIRLINTDTVLYQSVRYADALTEIERIKSNVPRLHDTFVSLYRLYVDSNRPPKFKFKTFLPKNA